MSRVKLGVAVGSAVAAIVAAGGSAPPAPAATSLLPHLRNARVTHLSVDTTTISGRRLLRYTSKIVNVGVGRLELRGTRASTSVAEMSVTQRVFDNSGGFSDVRTSGSIFFAGDGHNHWHLRDLDLGTLTRLDNGAKVGTSAKRGFCFFDNSNYSATSPAFYTQTGSCASGNQAALSAVMGLSVGWADVYGADLYAQWVDITTLKSGRYRLVEQINSNLGLVADLSDNQTWVDLKLSGNSVRIVQYGPGL